MAGASGDWGPLRYTWQHTTNRSQLKQSKSIRLHGYVSVPSKQIRRRYQSLDGAQRRKLRLRKRPAPPLRRAASGLEPAAVLRPSPSIRRNTPIWNLRYRQRCWARHAPRKLDLYGTFLGGRFGIPELIKAGGGSVINMSSNGALMGVAGRDCYTAAKGGIAAITRSLAVAYAAQRVRVNAIAPSATMTERVKKLIAGNAALTRLADSHLLGLIEPDDIANTALYLASDESRVVTGQILPVDSGVTIS